VPPCAWEIPYGFPNQEHSALDPKPVAAYPPAAITIDRIGDLVNYDLAAPRGAATKRP
jgi:hypothetical protein